MEQKPYLRSIKYLDYLEYGNKIKNGGFCKMQVEGENCKVQLQINGLYPTDSLQVSLVLLSGEQEYSADVFSLEYGKGQYVACWQCENLGGTGLEFVHWDGILVRISEQRILNARWSSVEKPIQEVTVQPEIMTQEISETKPEPAYHMEPTHSSVPAHHSEQEQAQAPEHAPYQNLYEDKWTQLGHYYKEMAPFGDERTYLSIAPRDFVILTEGYQKLVGNSFLLHGYYNYGYVILGKEETEGRRGYYLGVPGVYHEREKQVARMFGFEGFEGAASPYEEGSFGYYLRQVEL